MGRPSGAFCFLLSIWLAFTYLASTTGGHYVKSTLDCLTPAVLAQAAAALLYSINVSFRNGQKHVQEQQHYVGRRAWVLALGLLHLVSSTLTLASFGMSTVSHTYIIRTLEPIISCGMLYVIHGRKRSLTEVALLAVVAGATACGVLAGPQPVQQVLLSTDDSDALSPTLISSLDWTGMFARGYRHAVGSRGRIRTAQLDRLSQQHETPAVILAGDGEVSAGCLFCWKEK
jgi:drug/metabolite transporter (DMT)-like permease